MHTPTHWVDDNDREYTNRRVIRRNGVIIAQISEPTAGLGVDEVEANARLIAAAPELLTALKRLQFAAQCRDNTMGDPCRLLEVQAELRDAARHAGTIIAKAEGRAE